MIELIFCGEDYEQDVRPLISAFYPKESLLVKKLETGLELEAQKQHKNIEPLFLQIFFFLEKQKFQMKYCGIAIEEALNQTTAITEASKTSEDGSVFISDCGEIPDASPEKIRSVYRGELHRALYQKLVKLSGKQLPWGTLTGIRPVKLVLNALECGIAPEEIVQTMRQEYFCSEEKLSLSLQVAKKEKKILEQLLEKDSYSLYLGIPFCPTTCAYCSFTSYPLERFGGLVAAYLIALEKEILYAADRMKGQRLKTIYFGGGTPTTLEPEQLRHLLRLLQENFDCSGLMELTVEAGRPDSITEDKLQVLKEEGVTRISINPQSMRQRTLDLIGRKHTAKQIETAFMQARTAGHENINMDLILGLPGETPEDVAYTLERVKQLNPDSLTVHTLARKRAARISTEKEQFAGLAAKDVGKMQELTEEFTRTQGYEPYYLYRQKNMAENLENVGYAKPGKEGFYNILIMEERQTILALGAGGSSKFVFPENGRIERVENVKSLTDYIARIDEMIQRKQEFYLQHGR